MSEHISLFAPGNIASHSFVGRHAEVFLTKDDKGVPRIWTLRSIALPDPNPAPLLDTLLSGKLTRLSRPVPDLRGLDVWPGPPVYDLLFGAVPGAIQPHARQQVAAQNGADDARASERD